MFLEAAEVLVCPACRPAQGLVAVVDRMEARRIRHGYLGCAECERRYPIREGAVLFAAGGAGTPPGRAAADPETVRTAAALLGVGPASRGYVLVAEVLCGLGPLLAEVGARVELFVLAAAPGPDDGAVTRLVGADPVNLPLFDGRLTGVALWRAPVGELAEAVRVLAPAGRLVVLEPPAETREFAEETSVRILASEPRALVAERI